MEESIKRKIVSMWESRMSVKAIIRSLPLTEKEALQLVNELKADGTLQKRDRHKMLEEQVVSEYNRGTTDKTELCAVFGIAKPTLFKIAKNNGIRFVRPAKNHKKRELNQKAKYIIEDLRNGVKSKQIQARYGVSRQYVSQLKKRIEEEE